MSSFEYDDEVYVCWGDSRAGCVGRIDGHEDHRRVWVKFDRPAGTVRVLIDEALLMPTHGTREPNVRRG